MKKIIISLFFIFPLAAFGQLPNTTYISAYAGLSLPTNQNVYTSSFNAGANIEFALTKVVAFGFDINFANVTTKPSSEFAYPLYIGAITAYNYGNFSTMGFMAFAKLQSSDAVTLPVQPFVKIGFGTSLMAKTGVNYTSLATITNVPNETSTGILFAPSIGINIPIHAKNKITLEVQFRMNKSDSESLNQLLLNAGFGFRL
ncbi:MAG: hypothetical protein JST55_14765 [Bacteroidetes bacterium]|nr:hypothetical protein [Bacteroidota bacterium]